MPKRVPARPSAALSDYIQTLQTSILGESNAWLESRIVLMSPPQLFNGPARLFQPKYDGFHGVLYLTRKGCAFYSSGGTLCLADACM